MHPRHQAILKLLSAQKVATVEELAHYFNVSQVTIRKDLNVLEQQGMLLRRYGGAMLVEPYIVNQTTHDDISLNQQAIARSCAKMIQHHQRIIIDAGRTTSALIPMLSEKQKLVVMTNSLLVANQLINLSNPPSLLMTGGTWDEVSNSFQGRVAEEALRAYDFELLFIGADGIDMDRGTTTFNELFTLSKVMAEVSQKVVVMLESQKIGRKIPNVELSWDMIDVVVTDRHISPHHLSALKEKPIEVIIAE